MSIHTHIWKIFLWLFAMIVEHLLFQRTELSILKHVTPGAPNAGQNIMTNKWKRRERKQQKKKTGMRISGRSILDIVALQRKRAEKIRDEKRK